MCSCKKRPYESLALKGINAGEIGQINSLPDCIPVEPLICKDYITKYNSI